jgi:3-hydroxyisobutyrate dehydrogenase-like beta-hydroxyacid dehydrogenase
MGNSSLTVGILGLGEAGLALATDLASMGVDVKGWDPRQQAQGSGITVVAEPEEVASADVVMSVNSAAAAISAASSVAHVLGPSQAYADLNSGSPSMKQAVARIVEPSGASFVDVALMSAVPGKGIRTPAVVSGPGAEAFAARFSPLGMPIEVAGREPGEAAARKLVRSVFMKGLAAAVLESIEAAEAAGFRDWLWRDIVTTLSAADETLAVRLIEGSRRHAARRAEEMRDTCRLLTDLGIEPRVSSAAVHLLANLSVSSSDIVER